MLRKITIYMTIFTTVLLASGTNKDRRDAYLKYSRVMSIVERYTIDDNNIGKLVDKSISGLLANIDAHSSFLNKKGYQGLKDTTNGQFGGLGITISSKNKTIVIIAPIEGTPADKAGIKAGDKIIKIDGKLTLNMSLEKAVSLMRGKSGTSIKLTIIREMVNRPLTFKIKRAIIKLNSVYKKSIVKNDDILYLRITTFDKNVVRKTRKYILESKRSKKLKGIIIDLRNNSGGLLNQAVGLVDLFIDKGVIVSQKGRKKSENIYYKATKKTLVSKNVPIVVLVNGGTASASEIVSGALQDYRRAVIIGTKTFGKGSVQAIIPINKNEAVRLTIARYYLPSNRTIQAVGITPDMIVASGSIKKYTNYLNIKENDLKGHLNNDQITKKKKVVKKINLSKKGLITEKILNNDVQLKLALSSIKTVIILHSKPIKHIKSK